LLDDPFPALRASSDKEKQKMSLIFQMKDQGERWNCNVLKFYKSWQAKFFCLYIDSLVLHTWYKFC